jgi:hypothetical protein
MKLRITWKREILNHLSNYLLFKEDTWGGLVFRRVLWPSEKWDGDYERWSEGVMQFQVLSARTGGGKCGSSGEIPVWVDGIRPRDRTEILQKIIQKRYGLFLLDFRIDISDAISICDCSDELDGRSSHVTSWILTYKSKYRIITNLLKISNTYRYGFTGGREIKYVSNSRSDPPFFKMKTALWKTGSWLNSEKILFHSGQIYIFSPAI